MMSAAFSTLQAPDHWQTVDLMSDLHLQASDPATFEVWRAQMMSSTADAVLLLGDVFEVWVGDDAVTHDPFLQACADVLRQASQRMTVGFMPGNRDFLVGPAFLQSCGVQALRDPTLLVWGSQRIVLSHGDALCLQDEAYQRFRAVARSEDWQRDFLARPLTQRLTLATGMREQSKAHNQQMSHFSDADPHMTRAWLQAACSQRLVHGHTHRPADHPIADMPGAMRQVLSDWCAQDPARGDVLRLWADGCCERLTPASC